MIFYEPAGRDRTLLAHDPFKALIVPRPIGWVSTMSADGLVNLAPYSFFNAVADAPPMLAFSSNGPKDSATFATEIREFVWNLVTWELRDLDGRTFDQHLVIGQVVGVHLDEAHIVGSSVDTASLHAIARCGGPGDYTIAERIFEMIRPVE